MKVSVIIPCYNVEKYISDCIKSIEKQSFKELEVIAINDGSSDQTVEILEHLISASHLSIKLINQENKGAPSARNRGLEHSTGDYIQFLDADDILNPDKIKHQISLAQKNGFPEIVVGSYQRQNMIEEVLAKRVYSGGNSHNIWEHLMMSDLGITSANLFKSELFKNGIRWNEQLASSQEYELMFQILKKHDHIIFDPEVNTIIRVRDSGSISQKELDKKWERYVQLRIAIVKYLQEFKPSVVKENIYQLLFTSIRMLYPHNPSKAVSFFNEYIPEKFVPQVSASTGNGYVMLYKLFGFRNTEIIRKYITKKKAN